MRSSLASTATWSLRHLRNTVTGTEWAGEAIDDLTEVNPALAARVEWAEGPNSRWDIWLFDPLAAVEVGDILIDTGTDMAVTVTRVSEWPDLQGAFHHFELLSEEHELSVTELLAALP